MHTSSQHWVCRENTELGNLVSAHWFAELGEGFGQRELRIYWWVNWNPSQPPNGLCYLLNVTFIFTPRSCQNILKPLNHFHTEDLPCAIGDPNMQKKRISCSGYKLAYYPLFMFVFLIVVFEFHLYVMLCLFLAPSKLVGTRADICFDAIRCLVGNSASSSIRLFWIFATVAMPTDGTSTQFDAEKKWTKVLLFASKPFWVSKKVEYYEFFLFYLTRSQSAVLMRHLY